jgi:hypothetical protein
MDRRFTRPVDLVANPNASKSSRRLRLYPISRNYTEVNQFPRLNKWGALRLIERASSSA